MSIKTLKEEAQQRHLVSQQLKLADISKSINHSLSSDQIAASKIKSNKISKSNNNKKNSSANGSEMGWIKYSTKMDTHNFHLRNRQGVAMATLQV